MTNSPMNLQRKNDTRNYHKTQTQKDKIVQRLKEKGCRITKQRLIILDIILETECTCCKEIYYKASRIDGKLGTATVYRMINTLEEIGAISRKNMYKVLYSQNCAKEDACIITLDDNTVYHLSGQGWNSVIKAGLAACGYMKKQKVISIVIKPCECKCTDC